MGFLTRIRKLGNSTLCWSVLACFVIATPTIYCPLAIGQGTDQAEVKSLLDQGFYSFEEGDFNNAVVAFERAFALNPTNDAILDFVERATAADVYRMVRSQDARVAGIGRQILRSSTRSFKIKLNDPERIRQAVEEVLQSEGQEQLTKMIQYTATFGRNVVPYLLPGLADSDLSRRTAAMLWIGRQIGLDAVPVLQVARKYPDPTVRRNVASLLGSPRVRHAVSLATLQAMVELDSSADVRAAASQSLAAILAELNGHGKSLTAKEYFLENAYRYYLYPHRNPFASTYYTPTIYRLEGDQIVGERIAAFQFSERMAQQALEESLEIDPSFFEAQVLTLCNDAAQVYEYDLHSDHSSKNEGQEDTKAVLESQRLYVDLILRNRLLFWPEDVGYAALLQALDDGRPDVARKVVDMFQETGRNGAVPGSLIKALENSDSRLLRIAAATALAFWNPTSSTFEQGGQVVSLLSEGVVSSGVRTAVRVMGDNRLANRVEGLLRSFNMESRSAINDIALAYDAVVTSPPDVLIMDEAVLNDSGKKEIAPVNAFLNEIRKNYRSANVPVVVIVSSADLVQGKERYESKGRNVWVVPDSVDGQGLGSLFSKFFSNKDDAKARATDLAQHAAEAIEYLSRVPTRIPVKESVPALLRVLKNRPDEVRIPCIKALGNLRQINGAGELASVFANPENSHEVRVEAMRSVGKALRDAEAQAPQAVLETIAEGMRSADPELRKVSWFAFSDSGVDPERRYEALVSQVLARPDSALVAGEAMEEDEDYDDEEEDEDYDDEEEDEDYDDEEEDEDYDDDEEEEEDEDDEEEEEADDDEEEDDEE